MSYLTGQYAYYSLSTARAGTLPGPTKYPGITLAQPGPGHRGAARRRHSVIVPGGGCHAPPPTGAPLFACTLRESKLLLFFPSATTSAALACPSPAAVGPTVGTSPALSAALGGCCGGGVVYPFLSFRRVASARSLTFTRLSLIHI